MDILRDYQYVDARHRGASVAIGNFDGVHLGHQKVLDLARGSKGPLGVLTFEPHPREIFFPDAPPFRLMSATARANRLAKLGVQKLFEVNFSKSLASLTARDFAKDVLADGLGLSHVVVGADFCFGKGRAGDVPALRAFGAEFGFDVTVADILQGEDGAVSSTNIRMALSDGNPRAAAAMLGHWHRIDGPVVHGEKRGRQLGFPTANMNLKGLHLPKLGTYAVLVDVLEGPHTGSYHGAASLGVRPMFQGEVPNLETFVFDFKGDLYGTPLSVGLVDFLRPEQSFESVDALVAQMDADCQQARDCLGRL
jgi:riboflavin kinase/FMN adenylyltransferase